VGCQFGYDLAGDAQITGQLGLAIGVAGCRGVLPGRVKG